jgi:hypothetical protein
MISCPQDLMDFKRARIGTLHWSPLVNQLANALGELITLGTSSGMKAFVIVVDITGFVIRTKTSFLSLNANSTSIIDFVSVRTIKGRSV